MPDVDRTPPQSLEMERAVLGAMLIDNRARDISVDILVPEDFIIPGHAVLFETMQQMVLQRREVDMLTLQERLRSEERVDPEFWSSSYLVPLTNSYIRGESVRDYARIVKDKANRRRVMRTCNKIYDLAQDQWSDPDAFTASIEAEFYATVRGQCGNAGPQRIKDHVNELVEFVESRSENPGALLGIPTGITTIDRDMSGLQPGQLVIIAGRTSMGKTAWALNVTMHVVRHSPVVFFSLEMSLEQIVRRIASSEGRLDSRAMRNGELSPDEFQRFGKICEYLETLPLYIDATPGLSPSGIRAYLRRISATENISLVVVDYLTLLRPDKPMDSRPQEVGQITAALKEIAREFKVPVVALAQVNRGTENRADKRPGLADLRESGSIENDADFVAFVFRPAYYQQSQFRPIVEEAEIIVAKHRDGPTNIHKVRFHPKYTRFDNPPHEGSEPQPYVPVEEPVDAFFAGVST